MTFGSLFAGIGGMDLGLERAGMECKWQVEIDPFCQKVLAKHWPHVKRYGDITTIRGSELERVDLLAGGFPCQDLSVAGKRAGIDGARSGLWSHFARLIREIRPRFILIENVSGLLANEPMRRVLGDLSSLGFDAEWDSFRASQFGGPQHRERIFLLAYANGERFSECVLQNKPRGLQKGLSEFGNRGVTCGAWWSANISHIRVDDGLPSRLRKLSVKALGNSIVPQIPEWIGRQIICAYSRLTPENCFIP